MTWNYGQLPQKTGAIVASVARKPCCHGWPVQHSLEEHCLSVSFGSHAQVWYPKKSFEENLAKFDLTLACVSAEYSNGEIRGIFIHPGIADCVSFTEVRAVSRLYPMLYSLPATECVTFMQTRPRKRENHCWQTLKWKVGMLCPTCD